MDKYHRLSAISFIDWCQQMVGDPQWVAIDTETTGLKGQVIDLAIVTMSGEILFSEMLRPTCEIEPGAYNVHGISKTMLRDAPTFAQRWPTIKKHLVGHQIVGYNIDFDGARIRDTAARQDLELPRLHYYCFMKEYARYINSLDPSETGIERRSKYKLIDAYRQQGLSCPVQSHRALADTQMIVNLVQKLGKIDLEPDSENQMTLPQMDTLQTSAHRHAQWCMQMEGAF